MTPGETTLQQPQAGPLEVDLWHWSLAADEEHVRKLETLLSADEQSVFNSLGFSYGQSGWLPGYQSIARYHEDMDTVVIQFVNTTGRDTELTVNVVYDRIVRILRRQ